MILSQALKGFNSAPVAHSTWGLLFLKFQNRKFANLKVILPASSVRQGWEAAARFCESRTAERKNFLSLLIENFFIGARKNKNGENFSFLLSRPQGGVRRRVGGGARPSGGRFSFQVSLL
ncbi:hypothetical protein D6833_04820 [Candidatus Parcubacteria bacterium]|nr:MAG: hypothetical protein D6833_04820 [Candidatus Parcubacteria bacterium]